MKKLNQQGVTLVELLIASFIIATLATSVIMVRSFMSKQTVRSNDKAYATQKAIQMFEELKALVQGAEKEGVNVLDNYSDGSYYNTVLTTDKVVDKSPPGSGNAGDALSGNKTINGHWRYLRQVQVQRMPNDPYARQVIVKVWKYASESSPNLPGELLTTVGGLLRSITNVYQPTQVMDVYILALSNVLGWFTSVPQMQSLFGNVVADIKTRNPGLVINPHYVTQTGYGRDPLYRPYINSDHQTTASPGMPWIYFYPGSISDQYGNATTFFDPTQLALDGNIWQDGSQVNSPQGIACATCTTRTSGTRMKRRITRPSRKPTSTRAPFPRKSPCACCWRE